jgi:hypothetical protein
MMKVYFRILYFSVSIVDDNLNLNLNNKKLFLSLLFSKYWNSLMLIYVRGQEIGWLRLNEEINGQICRNSISTNRRNGLLKDVLVMSS